MDTVKLNVIAVKSTFQVEAKYVKGDPRNIAFVGKLQSQWI